MTNADVQVSLIRDVILQLIKRYEWQLLDAESFTSLLRERAQAACISEREPLVKLAITLYCEKWYAACGGEGEQRRRAHTELARYLYDCARYKYGDQDMAQEIAHDALILVSEQLGSCHKPGAFLAFVSLKLWNAATTHLRQRDRQLQRTESIDDQIEEYESGPVGLESAMPTPEGSVVATEVTTTLLTRVGELMQQAPRAQPQFKAVLLKFLYAYSDEEIARELETEVQNVHVLRSRGLKRLREDAVLRRLFEER